MLAYVLINLNVPAEQELIQDFMGMPQVKEAHILFGEWDLIVKVKGENSEDIASFVIEKVRNREEVNLTSTLIVAK
jgi:DNA-binding Lrp family transcriptional regulator